MKRVRVPEPTLAAELENVLETFEWVRDRVYRRNHVRKEQISLLRRGIAGRGKLSQAQFGEQTGLPADSVSRAASFICHKDRQWARSRPGADDRRVQWVTATPKGVAFLGKLDKQVEKEFFSFLGVDRESAEAAQIAEVVGKLNQELPNFVERHRQKLLF